MVIFLILPPWSMYMINKHRQWLYSKDCPEGRIFEEGEDVPAGYVDAPNKLQAVVKKKAAPKKKTKKKVK